MPFLMLFFYLLVYNFLKYAKNREIKFLSQEFIIENAFSVLIFIFLFIVTFWMLNFELQYYFLYPISKVFETLGNKYVLHKLFEYITLTWLFWGVVFIYFKNKFFARYKIHKSKYFYLIDLTFIYLAFYISIYLVVYFWIWKPHLFLL